MIAGAIQGAKVSVWIATANLKDVRVEAPLGSVGSRARAVRLDHGAPGVSREARRRGQDLCTAGPRRARSESSLGRRRGLAAPGFEMRECPRVHLKIIAVDGAYLYLGSANFTGAGLGAKGDGRRNFELGFATDDDVLLDAAQLRFDRIWTGRECGACRLRSRCPKPLDAPTVAPTPRKKPAKRNPKG